MGEFRELSRLFLWLFPFLFLALACYACVSFCLVCVVESRRCKVKLIMAGLVIRQSHHFFVSLHQSAGTVASLESFSARPTATP
jgi:hypothetical protein